MRALTPALVFLAIVTLAPHARAQKPACPLAPLVTELGDDSPHGPLEILLDSKSDDVSVRRARAALDQLLDGCDPTKPFLPLPDQGEAFAAAFEPRPSLEESARQFLDDQQVVSPFVSSVVGVGGGVPVPEALQVGLTQVVSAGQPGFMASLAGTLAPTSDNATLRHLVLATSVLVIQPSTPGTSGIPDPKFGALELQFGWNDRRTTYDWTKEIATTLVNDKAFEEDAQAAAEALVLEYAERRASLASIADETARNQELDQTARLAGSHARKQYGDNVKLRFWNVYVKPEIAREQDPRFATLALRVRYSSDVEFVPELPDLLSIGGEGSYQAKFALLGKMQVGGTAHGLASFSAYPTSRCPNRDAPDCKAKPTALVDADAGLTLVKPMTGGGASVLKLEGTFRWAPLRSVMTADGEEAEVSGGFAVSLEVPLGGGVALVGTYSRRWRRGLDAVSTSSFTVSQAFGGPDAPK